MSATERWSGFVSGVFMVSSGFLLLWFLSMTFANEFVIGIHAKFLGITENNILQFEYDARMTM